MNVDNKIWKMIIVVMVFLLSGMPSAQAGTVATLNGEIVHGQPGEKVNLNVTLSNGPEEVSSLNFDLLYDPAMLLVDSVVAGAASQSALKTASFSQVSPGVTRVVVFGLNQNAIPDGVVANVTIEIFANAIPGQSKSVSVTNISASSPGATKVIMTSDAASAVIIDSPGDITPPKIPSGLRILP